MTASEQNHAQASLDPLGILLNRIQLGKLETSAAAISGDISELSKFVNGKGALTGKKISGLLTAHGLKVVDSSRLCLRREEVAMLRRVYAIVVDQAPHLLNEIEG